MTSSWNSYLIVWVLHVFCVAYFRIVPTYKTKLNSVASVRERTIPTERPPPVGEWTPFQTHYYSENLVAPGIEPETSVSD